MTESEQEVRARVARLEESLRDTAFEANILFDSSVFGRAEVDVATGRFLRVNDCYCQITGYSREELVGMEVATVTHPDDRAEDWAKFSRMLRGEVPEYVGEKRYLRKDGRVIWVQVAAQAVRSGGGPGRSVWSPASAVAKPQAEAP